MTEAHDAVEVIIAKRDGAELSDSQIDWVIDAYTRGDVADVDDPQAVDELVDVLEQLGVIVVQPRGGQRGDALETRLAGLREDLALEIVTEVLPDGHPQHAREVGAWGRRARRARSSA